MRRSLFFKGDSIVKEFRVLRYRIDIFSIVAVLLALGVQLTAIWMALPWYTVFLILLLVRQVNLVEHNHAHLNIFYNKFLNETLGFICFLSNGTPYQFYTVHHVQNHHAYNQRFDDTEQDWSSMFGFSTSRYPDQPVGQLYYFLSFPIITICHSLIYILRRPDSPIFKRFVRTMVVFSICCAALIAINPMGFVFFFVLPWIVVSFGLGDNNYNHHHGCKMTNEYDSSNVFVTVPYRWLGFHIGYHVAHHIKPDLHWSKLPEYHESIKSNIPTENYRPHKYAEEHSGMELVRTDADGGDELEKG